MTSENTAHSTDRVPRDSPCPPFPCSIEHDRNRWIFVSALSGLDRLRYAPAMEVRPWLVKIIAGLAITALLLGGLVYMTLMTFTGSECTSEEEDLILVLAAQEILTAQPQKAVAHDSYTGCFQDDPFPYAGRFYEFPGAQEKYASFYATAAKADGWRPVATEELSTDICYTKKIEGATAFLWVGRHSVEGVEGYGIDISASYGDVPEDGGLLC
jgi:hypothetical protein